MEAEFAAFERRYSRLEQRPFGFRLSDRTVLRGTVVHPFSTGMEVNGGVLELVPNAGEEKCAGAPSKGFGSQACCRLFHGLSALIRALAGQHLPAAIFRKLVAPEIRFLELNSRLKIE